MTNETRSLWEVYDSEVEPWRRGRTILVLIGLFYFLVQALMFVFYTLSGLIVYAVIFAANVMIFWFIFYLIWVGVHWLRWVCGGWNLIAGFCLIIWGWRDDIAVQTVLGIICLVIGVCFCLSSSVYFFARRQRENLRWKEAVLIAAVCLLVLVSLGIGLLGLNIIHQERAMDASRFADETARHIYSDQDMEWALAHVTAHSLQERGPDRLRYFLGTVKRLGKFDEISGARTNVRIGLQLPNTFTAYPEATADAKTDLGTIELHTVLLDAGHGWEIDRMWWTPGASPQNSSVSK
jgi:hypothetical protein